MSKGQLCVYIVYDKALGRVLTVEKDGALNFTLWCLVNQCNTRWPSTFMVIGPATLVPTMWHHKLPTTIVISVTFSNFWCLILSLVA